MHSIKLIFFLFGRLFVTQASNYSSIFTLEITAIKFSVTFVVTQI